MPGRYLLMLLLFIAVAMTPAVIGADPIVGARAQASQELDVPRAAARAIRQGRYFRASQILREHLAMLPDTAPAMVLATAQAAAGWGDWPQVSALLAGRDWLDSLGGGTGWRLLGRSRIELGDWESGNRALERYLTVAQDTAERERGLVLVRRGHALVEARSFEEAVSVYAQAAERLPQLADWIWIYATRAASMAGDTARVRTLLERTEPGLARSRGWKLRVEALQEAGDERGALRVAESAASGLGTAGGRADAWRAVGELRLVLGDTAAGRTALRQAMEAAPGSAGAVSAARALSRLSLGPEEALAVGRLYTRHGNLPRAIAGLTTYLESGQGSALKRDQVRLELGRAQFQSGDYAAAERTLLALAEDPASPRIGAAALFQAGRAQYRQGRASAGQATFLRTAQRFPEQDAAAEALYLLADLHHDDQEIDRARQYYRQSTEMPPDIQEVGLAWMRLGGLAYLEGEYEEAARIYEAYRDRYPAGRRWAQATYWSGRARAEMGDSSAARTRMRQVRAADPISHYSMKAAEWLGEPLRELSLEPSPPRDPAIAAGIEAAAVRLDLLKELGDDAAVDYEIERLKDHYRDRDGALYSLAEALNERGETFTGILLGRDIQRREGSWNPRLLRIVYPFPYRDIILSEAEERGLDPYLVAGLIRRESMFNDQAVSPAGAIGLMQIMPQTGRQLARQAQIGEFRPDLLKRPDLNIHLGTAYFAELMDRYGGRLPAVLAAYNAGPHRLRQWSSLPEFRDMDLFSERIPYGETRDYVKFVQEHARVYELLYGPDRLGE